MDFFGTNVHVADKPLFHDDDEEEKPLSAEEHRNMKTTTLLFNTFDKSESSRDASLLDAVADLFAPDAVALNVRLLPTIFPYAATTTGGLQFVAQHKKKFFENDLVKVGEYVGDCIAVGPTVTVRSYINSWNVRKTGKVVRNIESTTPMEEVHSFIFNDSGRIQRTFKKEACNSSIMTTAICTVRAAVCLHCMVSPLLLTFKCALCKQFSIATQEYLMFIEADKKELFVDAFAAKKRTA